MFDVTGKTVLITGAAGDEPVRSTVKRSCAGGQGRKSSRAVLPPTTSNQPTAWSGSSYLWAGTLV
jgi:hypothetical protein